MPNSRTGEDFLDKEGKNKKKKKKKYNPFEGQYIIKDGKKVPRTPSNSSPGKP